MSSKFVITKNVCDNLDSFNLGQKLKKKNVDIKYIMLDVLWLLLF